MMKILIVNFSDISGGAARAANRLHNSLLSVNVESNMLVLQRKSNDKTIIGPKTIFNKLLAKTQSILNTFPLKNHKKDILFSASFSPSFNLASKINAINPDIVHLHWINAGMLKIEDFTKINAPIVWSLHDMWAFTGGCHYAGDCVAYKNSCGTCPVLESEKENDLSKKIFKRKQHVFSQIPRLTIIGLSKWLESCAKSSTLFKHKEVINLPNPIDVRVFKPFNKEKAREYFCLPNNKKLILFGSMSASSDVRKGFNELKQALRLLKTDNVEFLVFGNDIHQYNNQDFGFKTHYLGQLDNDSSLIKLYSTADVMVVPSLQENLSNVIMESLACGTPVVAFNIGGNSDMIDHKNNGYLAKPYIANDLASGINWVINNNIDNEVSKKARKKTVENFSNPIVAKKYIQLYTQILKK